MNGRWRRRRRGSPSPACLLGTDYQVQASFDQDFSTGVMSESFTTPAPSVTRVLPQYVASSSADVVVWTDDPIGVLYLRYRAGTSGTWTQAQQVVTSSPARLTIAGLAAGTEYQVQASFYDDFSTGVKSGSFTTLVPSVARVAVAGRHLGLGGGRGVGPQPHRDALSALPRRHLWHVDADTAGHDVVAGAVLD